VFPRNASRVLLAISYDIGQRSIRSRLTGTGLLRGARFVGAVRERLREVTEEQMWTVAIGSDRQPLRIKRQLYYGTALGKRRILPPRSSWSMQWPRTPMAFAASRRALCFWQRTFPSNACRWIKSEDDPFKRLEGQRNPHFSIISMRRRYVFFLSATRNTIGNYNNS
jgi:hypothetical protein